MSERALRRRCPRVLRPRSLCSLKLPMFEENNVKHAYRVRVPGLMREEVNALLRAYAHSGNFFMLRGAWIVRHRTRTSVCSIRLSSVQILMTLMHWQWSISTLSLLASRANCFEQPRSLNLRRAMVTHRARCIRTDTKSRLRARARRRRPLEALHFSA